MCERMKNSRVTVQDIAEYLNLSRNTVSKALNGQYVPQRTRELVLNAAIELGYKSYRSVASAKKPTATRRIALITSRLILSNNYFVFVVRGIESAISEEENIELLQFTTAKSTFFDNLVEYLENSHVDGIICIELFGTDYIPRLVRLGYPIVFLDFPVNEMNLPDNYDIVLPESFGALKNFCLSLMRERGLKTFGFVGDCFHCMSFYERFLAMREAIYLGGAQYDPAYSIVERDSFPYGNPKELSKALADMSALPDCFFTANDAIAISLVQALKLLGKNVPNDVLVVGFDNIAETKTANPPLTTFNVDKGALGRKLLSVLMERIDDPRQKTQTIYVGSKPILRQTT